jgi:ABC-type transport system involved in multi-copper enzyme maturation permease subunit
MRWLLWKDYRHNRLIVFTALALLLGPHLIGVGILTLGRWVKTDTRNGQAVYWTPKWQDVLAGTSCYSLFICQLTAALIGGNAIAGERVDRSAEFLYSLPIRRTRLLASKLLLALAMAAAIWLFNTLIVSCVLSSVSLTPQGRINWDFFLAMGMLATTGFTFFCVAWFCSSFIRSPALAVCAGLLAPFFVGSSIGLVDWLLTMSDLKEYCLGYPAGNLLYLSICLALAAVSFGVGTWHYLRRVEP